MRIGEIYDLAIRKGIATDPRGKEGIRRVLNKREKEYLDLKESEKKDFDQETLRNPYSDSRILYGDPNADVNGVLAGIDMEVGEVLLADRLRGKGKRIDLIISHHPEGKAMAALHDVMHVQEDELHQLGVPINVAEGLMAGRIAEVERRFMPINHNRAVDAAALLDIPMMCVHTPADNLVQDYLNRYFDKKAPETVGDIVQLLKEIPEYREAVKGNAGPKVVAGREKGRAGKIFVDMTGGTSGAKESFEKMAAAGVGTIVGMHMSEPYRKEAEKHHINVVIAGHIASDSLGLNLFLDELARRGVEITPCSGLLRVSR
ncbi:MAG: NGG1p interacting factor NIF3 [Syntrophaceticus sp.]|jgi:putative NIF3 family GTP cyclohydrolase 1 type 2